MFGGLVSPCSRHDFCNGQAMSLREPQSVGAGCPTKNHTSVHLGSLGTLCSRHDFCDGQAISLREPHSVGTESPTKDHRSEYEGSSNIRIMTTYVVFLIATRIGHATPHSHEAPEGINKRNFHILQYGWSMFICTIPPSKYKPNTRIALQCVCFSTHRADKLQQ